MAVTHIKDYLSPSELAKIYVKKNGEIGVSRNNIQLLIKKEIEFPGTSGIDVLILSGDRYFVRQVKKVSQLKR